MFYRMGHTACSCDLIVRKKQFPPVFWQRLYNYEATSGSKLIAEVIQNNTASFQT